MLENNFGPRVAKVLARAIAKRVYLELHLTLVEQPAFGLLEYVREAKSKFLKMNPREAEKVDTEIGACRETNGSGGEDCK